MDCKILINILNYNTFEKTKRCIDSCFRQKGIEYRILLIDNKSTDKSFEKIQKIFGDSIDYLQNSENFGYAKGNNLGIKFSISNGYKYSFILNSDTELVGDHLLQSLVMVLLNCDNCAVVAPSIFRVSRDNHHNLEYNDSSYLKLLRIARILPSIKSYSSSIKEVSEAHGSALLVDNKCFVKVSGFPEHYFMYGEESTFSKNIQWNGWKILWMFSTNLFVLHHHDNTGFEDPWRNFLRGRNRGLEYYENKSISPIKWKIVYNLFLLKMLLNHRNSMADYFNGLKEAKRIFDNRYSKSYCYDIGKYIRLNYKQS